MSKLVQLPIPKLGADLEALNFLEQLHPVYPGTLCKIVKNLPTSIWISGHYLTGSVLTESA